MAFKHARNVALSDLDLAHAEYDQLYQIVSDAWAELDKERDLSLLVVDGVEELAESIRHAPVTIKVPLKKISKEKQKFIDSAELKRNERKVKMAESAGAVAILGAGAAVAVSFWEYIWAFFEALFGKKITKNTVIWVIILFIALISIVLLFISWCITNAKTAREAAKNTRTIKKAINELKIEQVKISALLTQIRDLRVITKQFYDNLKCYMDTSFMRIPKEQRSDLIALMNHSNLLADLLNAKV